MLYVGRMSPARAALGAATLALLGAAPALAQTAVPQNGNDAAAIRAVLRSVHLPPGFSIALYALVPGARTLAVSPDGSTTFVGTVDTSIFALTNGANGAATAVRTFAEGVAFRMPHGLCFAPDGTLYVAEQNRISAFPHAINGLDEASPDRRTLVPQGTLIPVQEQSGNHSARICRVGPDGKLTVSLGQPYNVPPPDKLALYAKVGMGGIIRMDLDGSHREVIATGIRNSVGMDFSPLDQALWFTDNQVDGMGDDIPPGEIDRLTRPGESFGFPWYGGGHTRTMQYRADQAPADLTFPVVEEDAHAADLGMTFYRGTAFPSAYAGAIFSAQHGSWNRTVPVGARVMVTMTHPDGTADASKPFADGWRQADGTYAGRPVDVAELKDGSLLVSDDYAGAVYRISYAAP